MLPTFWIVGIQSWISGILAVSNLVTDCGEIVTEIKGTM